MLGSLGCIFHFPRLRSRFFEHFFCTLLARLKKTEQTGRKRNLQVEGQKNVRSPRPPVMVGRGTHIFMHTLGPIQLSNH